MKLKLLTNATVGDDAIRFVFQKSGEKVESTNSGNEDDKNQASLTMTDWNKKKKLGEVTSSTTNQVF